VRAADCFADNWDGAEPTVDYDALGPVIGAHCKGTDHQDIEGIERVVFVGDSVTVGTLPAPSDSWYRNQVTDALVARFGLEPPEDAWRSTNLFDGTSLIQESGDFACCAKFGARTDDLLLDPHRQLETCIPEDRRSERTLVIMTIGGNDLYSFLEDERDGVDHDALRATFAYATALLRDAAEWVADPVRFPNGAFLVFGNLYDVTDSDGASDIGECGGAQLIGLSAPLQQPITWEVMAEAQREMMSIAVDTQTDLVFLGEGFCGRGYNKDDETGRCYRGPDQPLWLDLICMHPNAAGHDALAQAFLEVIGE
jgi:lysophospholipase L1-like esterase